MARLMVLSDEHCAHCEGCGGRELPHSGWVKCDFCRGMGGTWVELGKALDVLDETPAESAAPMEPTLLEYRAALKLCLEAFVSLQDEQDGSLVTPARCQAERLVGS